MHLYTLITRLAPLALSITLPLNTFPTDDITDDEVFRVGFQNIDNAVIVSAEQVYTDEAHFTDPEAWEALAESVSPEPVEPVDDECAKDFDVRLDCWPSLDIPLEPLSDDKTHTALTQTRRALRSATISGAGLVVQPGQDWVYLGAPTLAHASTPVVETSIELFGRTVPVRFEAQEFVFDFHSGAAPVRTTSPGKPYPDMSIQTVYQRETDATHVTLTTTWAAFITHPHTGQTLRVDGALHTVEDSAPFKVIRPRQRLIAPEEFGRTQH